MTWFTASNISVASGSTIVNLGNNSITAIRPSDGFILGGFPPVEIDNAYVDGNGDNIIVLAQAWAYGAQTGAVRVTPTSGDFRSATTAVKEVTNVAVSNFDKLNEMVTTDNENLVLKDVLGAEQAPVNSFPAMNRRFNQELANVTSLTGSIQAMTKAEFFALAEQRKRESAGSGFAEWGKTLLQSNYQRVSDGLYSYILTPNQLLLGAGSNINTEGVSRTYEGISNISGVQSNLRFINTSSSVTFNKINFPPAPDGLDKADGTGRFADLAAAIVAGGNDLSASVLSRQDLVFLESWHEKISDKDVVYPLGNVQYGASTWESIGLSNTVESQGYSAFGEWDSNTKGYGVVWSTLTDEQKAELLQDPENNIYSADG